MNKFYRRFMGLIVLVFSISALVIYTTVDIHTLQNITRFQTWSIALAVLSVGLGLFFDGSRLMHLVKISHEKITLYQAVQVIFGNYFLALLTPGATGGAVAQLMFLRHAGVPTGKAAVLVIVRTLLSIFFLVLCMPLIFLNDEGILPGVSNEWLMGITVFAFLGIVFLVWGARRGFLDFLVISLTKRFSNQKRKKIFAFYRDTKSAISLLLHAPRSMLLVFLESGLNLLFIYNIPFRGMAKMMGGMVSMDMAEDILTMVNTPGGAGIAEGGFVMLFADTVPAGTVGIIAVCWRLIAEYIPFLIGFYYTLAVFGRDFVNRQLGK